MDLGGGKVSVSTQKIVKLQCTSIMCRNTWSGETMCAVLLVMESLSDSALAKVVVFRIGKSKTSLRLHKLRDCMDC